MSYYPKSKIVATIGPASSPEKRMKALLEAGVSVCRLNFSHGSHEDHRQILERIRKLEGELGRPIAILQDLCGPKIRAGKLPGGEIRLVDGQLVTIVAGLAESNDPARFGISVDNLAEEAQPGQPILLDDGLMEMVVVETRPEKKELTCRVVVGGVLKDKKGVNLPATKLTMSSVTEKDKKDLEWGLEHGVDYVALSFVRHEDDIKYLRERLAGVVDPPKIIAKIEKPEALERLPQILEAFDGAMVARGDLAVETPLYQVPAQQKRLIRMCNLMDRVVITATQMLDSMQEHPRPTRAEASDVANAIYDGSDAVMLSGETASGKYPIESVRTMRLIAAYADEDADKGGGAERHASNIDLAGFGDSLCHGAVRVAEDLKAKIIVTFTRTGKTALYMSKYHPKAPILGVTGDPRTARRMALYRGVIPVVVTPRERSEEVVAETEAQIIKRGLAAPGDVCVYIGGGNLVAKGNQNSIKVRRMGEAGGV